jgi:DNA-damage-inducible protein J
MKMAANALVTTRIDANIKTEASLVLSAMGLTVSDAVRLMLTKVAKEKALPFDVWQPNAETIAAMKEDLSKAPAFNSVADLMVSLNADD